MRIVLTGGGSFIAQAVAQACRDGGIDTIVLSHAADPTAILEPDDCMINFALDPRYRSGTYVEAQDIDLRAARAAAAKGAHFVMLSTRRVYGAGQRWGATEAMVAEGDETPYGRNKAASEAAVRQVSSGQAAIFRLPNIFGYEYNPQAPRRSFLGTLLGTLKQQHKIVFDMDPATQRDFLPVEICARLLVNRALSRDSGTWNLGSGFAVACGDLAGWIMEGFGAGNLVVEQSVVRDAFYLDMTKWRSRFELPVDAGILRDYCISLGGRLQCEKS